MIDIRKIDDYVTLRVRVQPKSSRNQCEGEHDGALKIALTSPPVDGAANKALCVFIAKKLRIAKSNVWVLSGDTGRNKIVAVRGVELEIICAKLCE